MGTAPRGARSNDVLAPLLRGAFSLRSARVVLVCVAEPVFLPVAGLGVDPALPLPRGRDLFVSMAKLVGPASCRAFAWSVQ
jgi:hypothetical protein